MQKFFKNFLFIAVLGAIIFIFRMPLASRMALLMETYLPCRTPITYSIGTFDTRFGISQADFLQAVKEAEAIWEKPIGKELFTSEPGGNLKINLIYDNRQAVTEKLHALGLTLSDTQASYDALKAKYDALNSDYEIKKALYTSLVTTLNSKESSYNTAVTQSNARGGAKPDEYARLTAEKQSLDAQIQQLNAVGQAINTDADNINALVGELNRVAGVLNLNVTTYNKIGATRGEEFDEGLYQSSPNGAEIDVYQYDNRAKLVRVLAHELGHALGLEHLDDPKAIMYKLNQGTNEKLTAADLAALKTRCGIK